MKKTTFMQRAIALASDNVLTNKGGPFGAVITKDDAIIAEGTNLVTTNHDPTAHAEVNAIRDACKKLNSFHLSGCEIYTSCEPCPMCLAAIYWARLDRIYYACSRDDAAAQGFDDALLYKELMLPHDQKKLDMEQFMQTEAWVAFQSWQNSDKKILY